MNNMILYISIDISNAAMSINVFCSLMCNATYHN